METALASASTQAAPAADSLSLPAARSRTSLVVKFATRYNLDADKLLPILKATAFKVKDGEVSNEQMAALLVVADQYGLNPFTREIFAFPDKQGGIVPVVSVDGWSRIINDHAKMNGVEFRYSEAMIKPADNRLKGLKHEANEWIECVIYRKDRDRPIVIREYLDEVYREPFEKKGAGGVVQYVVDSAWQSHTRRFHRHKTLIQCSRVAFGFAGIYDEDEAQRILEGESSRVIEPTKALPAPERSATARLGAAISAHTAAEASPAAGAAAGASTGNPAEERPPTLEEACAELQNHSNSETMSLYAETLPETVVGDERFTKAFKDRLAELKPLRPLPGARAHEFIEGVSQAVKDDDARSLSRRVEEQEHIGAGEPPDLSGAKKTGTPKLRKLYVDTFAGAKTSDALDLCFDETRGYNWGDEDAKKLLEAYQARKAEIEVKP